MAFHGAVEGVWCTDANRVDTTRLAVGVKSATLVAMSTIESAVGSEQETRILETVKCFWLLICI